MAWEKKSDHIDEAQGVHYVFFHDPASSPPAEHHLMILIGHDVDHVGRVTPRTNLEEIDPKAIIAAELDKLHASMAGIKAYGKKHNIPGKKT